MKLSLNMNLFPNAINPLYEIVAYEALWENRKASFKSLSELFASHPNCKPSDLVSKDDIEALLEKVKTLVIRKDMDYKVNLLINETFDYPNKLKDAKEPVEVLYYAGDLDLLSTRSVAIRRKVRGEFDSGSLYPEPLIQFNPSFESGGKVEDLLKNGILTNNCNNILSVFLAFVI